MIGPLQSKSTFELESWRATALASLFPLIYNN